MRRNRRGRTSRAEGGRRRAVTVAGRITVSGTAAAVAICAVGALAAGHALLNGSRDSAIPDMAPSTLPAPPVSSQPPPGPQPPVRAPVVALMQDIRRIVARQLGAAARREYGTPGTGRPTVHLIRTAGSRSWAFGTTAIPVPGGSAAPPSTAFFVAHARGRSWHVAVSGSKEFGRLLGSAAGKVVSPAEAAALARFTGRAAPAAAGDGARLALPWRTGQSWRLVAAFSGPVTGTTERSMLAFTGGDGRVRAAGPGRLYRFCGGRRRDALIEIIHPDGTATMYYQLRAETRVRDGGFVAAGSYLGMAGTSLACGGVVHGPGSGPGAKAKKPRHRYDVVAFAVIRPDGTMGLNGLVIGGWTFHERGKRGAVWAQRASVRVRMGGSLRNFGPADKGVPTASPTPAATPSVSPSPRPSSRASGTPHVTASATHFSRLAAADNVARP